MKRALCCAVVALVSSVARGDAPRPLLTFETNKAEQLLRSQLPCLGCHTLHGQGGRTGPELSTVRTRRSPAYVAALLEDPQKVVPGTPMPRPMLPDRTRTLLLRYLVGGASSNGGTPQPPASAPSATSNGAALYAHLCSACHGAAGRGDGPNAQHLPVRPTDHTDRQIMHLLSDDRLYDTIAAGGAAMNRSPCMPGFAETLNVSQIKALVRQLRRLCNCEAQSSGRDGESSTQRER